MISARCWTRAASFAEAEVKIMRRIQHRRAMSARELPDTPGRAISRLASCSWIPRELRAGTCCVGRCTAGPWSALPMSTAPTCCCLEGPTAKLSTDSVRAPVRWRHRYPAPRGPRPSRRQGRLDSNGDTMQPSAFSSSDARGAVESFGNYAGGQWWQTGMHSMPETMSGVQPAPRGAGLACCVRASPDAPPRPAPRRGPGRYRA